ncbi:MAG: alpha/beta hydrolase [Jatrophihabitans sp.]
MTSSTYLPGSDPVSIDGGAVGVVVSHGFTGTPASMRPWAEHLGAAGYTVRLPRLPGHGTTWQDMNRTTWRDWYAEVDRAYDELSARCSKVFVCGLSMGGSLVTKLAIEHADVAGLVLVNPAYGTRRVDAKFARYVAWALRSQKGIGSDIKAGGQENGYDRTPLKAFVSLQDLWRTIVPDLGRISAPIRLYTSREDHVVDDLSAELLRTHTTNTTIEQVWLEDSYHVATLDNDAQTIFDGSVEFIAANSNVTG